MNKIQKIKEIYYQEENKERLVPVCLTCKNIISKMGIDGGMYNNIIKVKKDTIKTNKLLYGDSICITYFMEESSELNKKLSKLLRGKGDLKNIKEEISDVYYTLSMLIQDMDIGQEEINKIIENKQLRAEKEMNMNNNNKGDR